MNWPTKLDLNLISGVPANGRKLLGHSEARRQ